MPHVFSPSQVHVWDLCKRKWAWQNIAKLPRGPQSAGAALGDRVDALARVYYTNAQHLAPPDTLEGRILLAALEHLPKHGPLVRVGDFRRAYTRHVWACKTDLETIGTTYDLKTTSDFRYAMTSAQLARDPQAVVYARATGSLGVNWVYTLTRGAARKAISVSHTFTPEELAARVNDIDLRADAMQLLLDASNKDVLAIEPNYEACSAFGGCPYQENCRRSQNMSIMDLFGLASPPVSVSPLLQDAGNFLVGAGGAPGGPVVVAPNGLPLSPFMISSQTVPNAERTAAIPIRPVTPEQAENLNVLALQFQAQQGQALAAINPPEQVLPPGHPVGFPPDIAALLPATAPTGLWTETVITSTPAPAPVETPAPARGPGRPRKVKEVSAEGAEVVSAHGVTMIVIHDATLAKALVDAITVAQLSRASL